mgnify:CR=1 FL=1
MDFTIENFDFKVSDLGTVEEVNTLLEEYDLQIKAYNVKLETNELKLTRAENRSDTLAEDIQDVEAQITAKQTELANLTSGSRKHEEASIALDGLNFRLRGLKFRRDGSANTPLAVVESNADLGEARLLLDYYTKFKEALEQRKTALGG